MPSEASQDPARVGATLFSELLRHPNLKGTWNLESSPSEIEDSVPTFFKDPENPFSFYFGYQTGKKKPIFLRFELDLKEGKWRFDAKGIKRRFVSLEKLIEGIFHHFERENMIRIAKAPALPSFEEDTFGSGERTDFLL